MKTRTTHLDLPAPGRRSFLRGVAMLALAAAAAPTVARLAGPPAPSGDPGPRRLPRWIGHC